MDEMIECVERAIHAALTNTDFDASHMKDNQLAAAARAAIGAMRIYLKEHDNGFQCQQCNAMVDVDAALGKIAA